MIIIPKQGMEYTDRKPETQVGVVNCTEPSRACPSYCGSCTHCWDRYWTILFK